MCAGRGTICCGNSPGPVCVAGGYRSADGKHGEQASAGTSRARSRPRARGTARPNLASGACNRYDHHVKLPASLQRTNRQNLMCCRRRPKRRNYIFQLGPARSGEAFVSAGPFSKTRCSSDAAEALSTKGHTVRNTGTRVRHSCQDCSALLRNDQIPFPVLQHTICTRSSAPHTTVRLD